MLGVFAAPQVAGLMADLYALHPTLTPDEAEQILKLTATPAPGQETVLGSGVIHPDAARTLAFIWPQTDTACTPSWALDTNAYGGAPDGYFGLDDLRGALANPNFNWGSQAAIDSAYRLTQAADTGDTTILAQAGFFPTEDGQWLHETRNCPLI